MTAIGGHVAATRLAGALGVHLVGGFVLGVPDVQAAADFYGAFGLDIAAEGNALGLRTADGYRWGQVVEAPRKAMGHVSFHCFAEDFARLRAHVEATGVRLLDPPPGFEGEGFWLRDPDGMLLEVRVGVKTQPDAKLAADAVATPAGVRNAPYRRNAERTRPRRLSHILRFTPDVDRAIGFYARVLGLRLSDRSGDVIAFMHAIHGSDHHVLAFAKSSAPGMHHLSWDVASVDAIGLGAMGMAERGYRDGWGFGRHVLGSNYFHYVRDPWGSYSEYSCDIDYVPGDGRWEAMDHPAEDGFYLWGAELPADFVRNFEGE